jgi:hypothetical protein
VPSEENTGEPPEPEGYWSCEFDPVNYPQGYACGCGHVPGTCEYCHYVPPSSKKALHKKGRASNASCAMLLPFPLGLTDTATQYSSNLYSHRCIAKYCGACHTIPLAPTPMTTEENIRALSLRMTAAPENSEEFRIVMDELRAGMKASAARGREKIAALKRVLSHSEDAKEITY